MLTTQIGELTVTVQEPVLRWQAQINAAPAGQATTVEGALAVARDTLKSELPLMARCADGRYELSANLRTLWIAPALDLRVVVRQSERGRYVVAPSWIPVSCGYDDLQTAEAEGRRAAKRMIDSVREALR